MNSTEAPQPTVWPTLRARDAAAGAEIVEAPVDRDYGSREFIARDPEGNLWSFGTYRGAPRGA